MKKMRCPNIIQYYKDTIIRLESEGGEKNLKKVKVLRTALYSVGKIDLTVNLKRNKYV